MKTFEKDYAETDSLRDLSDQEMLAITGELELEDDAELAVVGDRLTTNLDVRARV